MSKSAANLLGVRVDRVTIPEIVTTVASWLDQKSGKHYIVTPNLEFIIEAQHNSRFKQHLNQADLAIPDSARLGWLEHFLQLKTPLERFLYWWGGLLPKFTESSNMPVSTGIDTIMALSKEFAEKGFTIGLFGGRAGVAGAAAERLKQLNPQLKISFAIDGIKIGNNDSYDINNLPKADLVLVALGQVKQEQWMVDNLTHGNARIMMGVGGSLDYLSGKVARAPKIWRQFGFEWLYRLLMQPWRIKRQFNIVIFLVKLLFKEP